MCKPFDPLKRFVKRLIECHCRIVCNCQYKGLKSDYLRNIAMDEYSPLNQFFLVVLFLNLIAMACSSHNQSDEVYHFLYWLDIIFTGIFTCELTFKLVVVGPGVYFDDGTDLSSMLDAFIVASSLAEIVLSNMVSC